MEDQEISQWLDVDTDMTAQPGPLSRKEHTTNPNADNQSSPNAKLLGEALSRDVWQPNTVYELTMRHLLVEHTTESNYRLTDENIAAVTECVPNVLPRMKL